MHLPNTHNFAVFLALLSIANSVIILYAMFGALWRGVESTWRNGLLFLVGMIPLAMNVVVGGMALAATGWMY